MSKGILILIIIKLFAKTLEIKIVTFIETKKSIMNLRIGKRIKKILPIIAPIPPLPQIIIILSFVVQIMFLSKNVAYIIQTIGIFILDNRPLIKLHNKLVSIMYPQIVPIPRILDCIIIRNLIA